MIDLLRHQDHTDAPSLEVFLHQCRGEFFNGDKLWQKYLPPEVIEWGMHIMEYFYKTAPTPESRKMIQGKMFHTADVLDAGFRIISRMPEQFPHEPALFQAAIILFLHDIARFLQAHTGTFSDTKSKIDHAAEAVRLIMHSPDPEFREAIRRTGANMQEILHAIHHHSRKNYSGVSWEVLKQQTVHSKSDRLSFWAMFARDADKLGILQETQHQIELITTDTSYDPHGPLSCKIIDVFEHNVKQGKRELIDNTDVLSQADEFAKVLSWQFDFNFPQTHELYLETPAREVLLKELRQRAGALSWFIDYFLYRHSKNVLLR